MRGLLAGHSLLTMKATCLDGSLYATEETGARVSVVDPTRLSPADMALAIISGQDEATLLDIPDALLALQTFPGEIKVIGPLSEFQVMGYGFRKDSPQLREAFNDFFRRCREDGTYRSLIEKYYPTVFLYQDEFFEDF